MNAIVQENNEKKKEFRVKTMKFSSLILEGYFISKHSIKFNNEENPGISDVIDSKILSLMNKFVSIGDKWFKLRDHFLQVRENLDLQNEYSDFMSKKEALVFDLVNELVMLNVANHKLLFEKIKEINLHLKILRNFINFKIKYYKYAERHDEYCMQRQRVKRLEEGREILPIISDEQCRNDFRNSFSKAIPSKDKELIDNAAKFVERDLNSGVKKEENLEESQNCMSKERFVPDMTKTKAERAEDKKEFYRKKREEKRSVLTIGQ
jgi:hypothetical protein